MSQAGQQPKMKTVNCPLTDDQADKMLQYVRKTGLTSRTAASQSWANGSIGPIASVTTPLDPQLCNGCYRGILRLP